MNLNFNFVYSNIPPPPPPPHIFFSFFFLDIHQFSMTSDELAISLQPIDNLRPRPLQLPMAIPSDLADG